MYCPNCGKEDPDSRAFCSNCGASLKGGWQTDSNNPTASGPSMATTQAAAQTSPPPQTQPVPTVFSVPQAGRNHAVAQGSAGKNTTGKKKMVTVLITALVACLIALAAGWFLHIPVLSPFVENLSPVGYARQNISGKWVFVEASYSLTIGAEIHPDGLVSPLKLGLDGEDALGSETANDKWVFEEARDSKGRKALGMRTKGKESEALTIAEFLDNGNTVRLHVIDETTGMASDDVGLQIMLYRLGSRKASAAIASAKKSQ